VIRAPRLLCNANSQDPSKNPAKVEVTLARKTRNLTRIIPVRTRDLCNDKKENRRIWRKHSHNRGMQAEPMPQANLPAIVQPAASWQSSHLRRSRCEMLRKPDRTDAFP